ncbi:unnamed protein product, partial [Prorocentrum cordatum]
GVIVNSQGTIIDAVYFNNMKALKCVTHSGDERTGEKEGHDEVIWVGLNKLPEHVKMMLFVVAVHSGGSLRDVRNGVIHALEENKDNEVARIEMERSGAEVDVVATLVRSTQDPDAWTFSAVQVPAQHGHGPPPNFMDVLEPTMGNLIRAVIPGAPKRQKVAFAMEKGDVLDLPATGQLSGITAGLGWDVEGEGRRPGRLCRAARRPGPDRGGGLLRQPHGQRPAPLGGQPHGRGRGRRRADRVRPRRRAREGVADLLLLPSSIVVNIYTRGVTFRSVSNAYCRIFGAEGCEMARFQLTEGGRETALIMARLFREGGGRWGFQAIGTFSRGHTWKDTVPDLVRESQRPPRELQLRAATALSFGSAPQVAAAPRANSGCGPGKGCALQ